MHGRAHAGARVPLSPAATVFVYAIVLAGPPAGLVLARAARRAGSFVVAFTMAGSLVFGLVNHFAIAGPDHVAHVDPGWRVLFSTTAVLLALLEAAGTGLAIRLATERTSS